MKKKKLKDPKTLSHQGVVNFECARLINRYWKERGYEANASARLEGGLVSEVKSHWGHDEQVEE